MDFLLHDIAFDHTKGDDKNFDAQPIVLTHLSAVQDALRSVVLAPVLQLITTLRVARDEGRFIYIAGNGGSAATASHWANDLGKATKRSGRSPLKVICLSDNTPWFSALANDEGYERAFAGQLENFVNPGDVLVCISASGNSPNLIHCVDLARRYAVSTAALLGFDGGALHGLVENAICIRSEKGAYELVEDAHSVICHAITRALIADRGVPRDL